MESLTSMEVEGARLGGGLNSSWGHLRGGVGWGAMGAGDRGRGVRIDGS